MNIDTTAIISSADVWFPRADLHTLPSDPVGRLVWNEKFENELALTYPEQGFVTANVFRLSPLLLHTVKLWVRSGVAAHELVIRTPELVRQQWDLALQGVKYLGATCLEEKWRNSTRQRKEDVAREAIYLVCKEETHYRLFCPEMTLRNLSQNFFPLLNTIIRGVQNW